MPYREKTAWLWLLAMAVTFGPYFTLTATRFDPSVPMPNLRQLGWFAVTAIVEMLLRRWPSVSPAQIHAGSAHATR